MSASRNARPRVRRLGRQFHALMLPPHAAAAGVRVGRERLPEFLAAALGLLVFLAALEVLRIDARSISWVALTTDIADVPMDRLALAVGLTMANYAILTAYDSTL